MLSHKEIEKRIQESRKQIEKRIQDNRKQNDKKMQEKRTLAKKMQSQRVKLKAPQAPKRFTNQKNTFEETKAKEYHISKDSFKVETIDSKKQNIINRANQAINGSQKPKHLEALNVAKEMKTLDETQHHKMTQKL